jgi:hypothetical protein
MDSSELDLLDNDVIHLNTTSKYTIISLYSYYPSYVSLSVLEKNVSQFLSNLSLLSKIS